MKKQIRVAINNTDQKKPAQNLAIQRLRVVKCFLHVVVKIVNDFCSSPLSLSAGGRL